MANEEIKNGKTREKDSYQTAFYIMTALVLILVFLLLGMRLISAKSEKQNRFYTELLTENSEPEPSETEEKLILKINAASAPELTLLPGIGETKAKAIVRYREEYGPFTSPEDLLRVNGIGQGILEKILPYLDFTIDERKIMINGEESE